MHPNHFSKNGDWPYLHRLNHLQHGMPKPKDTSQPCLNDATNVPREKLGEKTRHEDVLSNSKFTPPFEHLKHYANRNHRQEPKKALLNSNWRQKPTLETLQAASHASDSATSERKCQASMAGKINQKQAGYSTTFPRTSSAPRSSRSKDNHHVHSGLAQSEPYVKHNFNHEYPGDSSEDDSEGSIAPKNHSSPSKSLSDGLELGTKFFYRMDSLHCPTLDVGSPSSLTDFSLICSSDWGSGSNSSLGLATISENASDIVPASCLSGQSIHSKPTVQIQQVKKQYRLKSVRWSTLRDILWGRSTSKPDISWSSSISTNMGHPFKNDPSRSRPPPCQSERQLSSASSQDSIAKQPEMAQEKQVLDENAKYQTMLAKLQKTAPDKTIQDTPTVDLIDLGSPAKQRYVSPVIMVHDQHRTQPPCQVGNMTTSSDNHNSNSSQKARTLNPRAPEFYTAADVLRRPATIQSGGNKKSMRPSVYGLFDGKLHTTAVQQISSLTQMPPMSLNSDVVVASDDEVMVAIKLIQSLRQIEKMKEAYPNTDGMQPILGSTWDQCFHKRGTPCPCAQSAIPAVDIKVPAQSFGQYTGPLNMASQRSEPAGFQATCLYPNGSMPPIDNISHKSPYIHRPTVASAAPPVSRGPTGLYVVPSQGGNKATARRAHMSRSSSSIESFLNIIDSETSLARNHPQNPETLRPFNTNNALLPRDSNSGTIPHALIGPKPVCKPKGPPRPNDPVWCQQQIEYESYLEWRRTCDPEYHRECRDRQANRAEKKIRMQLLRDIKVPEKRNAAVQIKKPSNDNGMGGVQDQGQPRDIVCAA